ncbi:hypothetical protein [Bosea sp. CRIB-10]|uniref:hypothetical protein n=1 Tax=Bosea sp. CRIB-10 TaxID=378404 RepID=UPI001FCCD274|nr:hypothetical protein [Bosea sp. CRIB-10]
MIGQHRDDAAFRRRPAMDGKPGRLVDHEHHRVAVQDSEGQIVLRKGWSLGAGHGIALNQDFTAMQPEARRSQRQDAR